MTIKITTADIRRYFRFADEDRNCAFDAADVGDWDDYDNLMACAESHETTARGMQHQLFVETRFT